MPLERVVTNLKRKGWPSKKRGLGKNKSEVVLYIHELTDLYFDRNIKGLMTGIRANIRSGNKTGQKSCTIYT